MANAQENVLIVDDEEMIRWILNKKLSKEGYSCDEAGDTSQALAKLQANPTDLVVLDINMPGRPGNELLPEIRSTYPETAVVMASGVTDNSIIARCIKDGAQDYIRKPFHLVEVVQSINMALEKMRLELKIRNYQQQYLSRKYEMQVSEMRRVFLGAVKGLVCKLEASDKYTAGHSRDVTNISVRIGKQLGLGSGQLDDLLWGALLHDVGKIAVDPAILNKPGELTSEEYRHIMTHAVVGPSLVRPLLNDRIVDIISHHHDHYDGSGLDQTVLGEDIPLGARIVAVADAFDAMTSNRPYRSAMSTDEAMTEMKRCRGTQFDPNVTDILLQITGCETA